MELRHLRYFVALAEALSFTRAAERLHISQPPLSIQISQLEEQVGAALFDRTSRRVQLTPAGQAFLQDARSILERVEAAGSHARAVAKGMAGRIEIGLSGSHFQGPLPRMIAGYMHDFPDVAVVLNELKPATQLEALRHRRIDLSISRTAVDDVDLISARLWSDPVRVALPRGHALAKRRRLALRDLRRERFIMLRLESSAYAQHLHDRCVQAGFAPNIVQLVLEVPAMIALVAVGIGIALVPASLCHLHAAEVAYVPLGPEAPHSEVYVVRRREEDSGVVNGFLRLITASAGAATRRTPAA